MKIGRNDSCWCGSGKKYKSCHMEMDEKLEFLHRKGAIIPTHKMIKTPQQLEGMRKAGKANTIVLDEVSKIIKEGITTQEIDDLVVKVTKEIGGIAATLDYEGYPKSVCTSINEVVCHGIPSENRVLQNGDIINVDCTTLLDGYYGDASRMYMIGEVSEKRQKLVRVAKECRDLATDAVKPYVTLGDLAYITNQHAIDNGFSVVREIGGHSIGTEFHEDPWVPHVGRKGTLMTLVPGMTFTIEPMVNMGKPDVFTDSDDGWTVYTEDNQPSAQWEYTIAVTETGVEVLSY